MEKNLKNKNSSYIKTLIGSFVSLIFSCLFYSILSHAETVRCEHLLNPWDSQMNVEQVPSFSIYDILGAHSISGKVEIQKMTRFFSDSFIFNEIGEPLEAQLSYDFVSNAHKIFILFKEPIPVIPIKGPIPGTLIKGPIPVIPNELNFNLNLKNLVGWYVYNQQQPKTYLYQYEFIFDKYNAVVIMSYNLFLAVSGRPLFRLSVNITPKDGEMNGGVVDLTFTHEDQGPSSQD